MASPRQQREPPTSITINIKVAPYHNADGTDSLSLGEFGVQQKIADVRTKIQQTLHRHPPPERQRLLYGGRALLDNEQTLSDALNIRRDPEQVEYTMHLVVKEPPGTHSGPSGPLPQPQSRSVPQPPVMPPMPGQMQQQQIQAQQLAQQRFLAQVQRGGGAPGGYPSGQQPAPNAFTVTPGARVISGPGFTQALAQQQQQRAAMGMQGLGAQGITGTQGQETRGQESGMEGHGSTNTQAQPQPAGVSHQAGQNGGQDANGQGVQARPSGFYGALPAWAQGPPPQRNPQLDPNAEAPQGHSPLGQPPPQVESQPPLFGHPRDNTQQPHQPGAQRPISGQGFHVQGTGPNGSRFAIHQQTLQFPHHPPGGLFGGQHFPPAPFGAPMMQGQQPYALFPGAQPQPTVGPSALDRARDNVAEMRRMLDEMRNEGSVTDEQRSRLDTLQQRTQALDGYIDPLGLRNAGNIGRTPAPPAQQTAQATNTPFSDLHQRIENLQARQQAFGARRPQVVPPPSNSETTCYLLSGPQGPQALLFSPEHGSYTGSFPRSNAHPVLARSSLFGPTPTTMQHGTAVPGQQNAAFHQGGAAVANQPGAPAAAPPQPGQPQQPNAAQAQQQPHAQDPLAPFQPLMAHLWFLFRVLIFAYFLLGSGMGWRRPLFLIVLAITYWMIRVGFLNAQNGLGGAVRGWWEGLVGVPRAAAEEPRREGQQMLTPEQVAERLIRERRERQQGPLPWWREQIRPLERAVALFVASLWPGVGEAHVRAREEEEERRRNEAEVEEARRVVEQQQLQEGQVEGSSVAVDEGKAKVDGADGASASMATGGGETTASASGIDVSAEGSSSDLRARDGAGSGGGGPTGSS